LEPPDPPADRYYVYDSSTPTLAICVTVTGKKTFYRYGRIKGVPVREKLGRWPEMTLEAARKKLSKLNADIADGKDPAEERRMIRATMTLGELWTYYLETHAKPHKRSWKADEWLWGKFLKAWESRRLPDIRRADVQQLHATLGKSSIYNANRTRSLLMTMFEKAADAGYEGQNPVSRVKPFREVKRSRHFTAAEVQRLFTALDAEQNEVLADAIRFGLWTGARRGNWLSARWDEIDLERRVWTIPAAKAKAAKPIVVPLNEQAYEVLKRRVVASEWVFPGRWGEHATTVKFAWARVIKAAGLTDARIHDLRRTLATFAVNAGVPIFLVAKMLGHTTTAVTEAVYAQIQDEALRGAAADAGRAIVQATKGGANNG
jgi:integrase